MLLRNVGNYQCLGNEFSKKYKGLQNHKFHQITWKVFLVLHKVKVKKNICKTAKWALNMWQSVTINCAHSVNDNLCKYVKFSAELTEVNNVHYFQLRIGESLCSALFLWSPFFFGSQQNVYSNGCRTQHYFYSIVIKIVRNILMILIKKSVILWRVKANRLFRKPLPTSSRTYQIPTSE